eukprot:Opistho-2@70693
MDLAALNAALPPIERKEGDANITVREGWLAKQGQVLKKWIPRLFVLRDYVLNYYKDAKSKGGDPMGTLDMRGARLSPGATESDMSIVTRDGARYSFQAASPSDREEWMRVLRAAAERVVKDSDTMLGIAPKKDKPLDLAVITRMIDMEEERLKDLTAKYESYYDPPATLENLLMVQQMRVKELRIKRQRLEETAKAEDAISRKESTMEATRQGQLSKMTPEDFTFWKVLGKGTFGKVMLASKKDTKTIYAVKIIKKSVVQINEQSVTHANTENRVLKLLHHPFLVRLECAFQTDDRLYFVMEYINGGEVYTHLQRTGRFTEEKTRFYIAEITSALTYLHDKGIVYRDLKLENLLLDKTGHVKITDFGLSKDNLQMEDRTTTFCGTPEYIAPEVLEDDDYGKSVDWWALGIVCYEMLNGQPPFQADDVEALFEMTLTQNVQYPSHFSELTISFVSGLLERDPASRLGYGMKDGEAVMRHKFLTSIDFAKLNSMEVAPPFIPTVSNDLDVSNFDAMFTKEPAVLTPNQQAFHDAAFNGFSYQATGEHL